MVGLSSTFVRIWVFCVQKVFAVRYDRISRFGAAYMVAYMGNMSLLPNKIAPCTKILDLCHQNACLIWLDLV